MAFLVKKTNKPRAASAIGAGVEQIDSYTHVVTAARVLPAGTTDQIFRVKGGRVLVKALVGEVTTAADATVTNLKVTSKKLNAAGTAAVGTAVDVASNVAVTSLELGGLVFVEGDGTALVKSNAGAAFVGANSGNWIAPNGEIYITTDATNAGAFKWDLFYMPLDEGAYVESVGTAAVAI